MVLSHIDVSEPPQVTLYTRLVHHRALSVFTQTSQVLLVTHIGFLRSTTWL